MAKAIRAVMLTSIAPLLWSTSQRRERLFAAFLMANRKGRKQAREAFIARRAFACYCPRWQRQSGQRRRPQSGESTLSER
jgi:hypothetical protein